MSCSPADMKKIVAIDDEVKTLMTRLEKKNIVLTSETPFLAAAQVKYFELKMKQPLEHNSDEEWENVQNKTAETEQNEWKVDPMTMTQMEDACIESVETISGGNSGWKVDTMTMEEMNNIYADTEVNRDALTTSTRTAIEAESEEEEELLDEPTQEDSEEEDPALNESFSSEWSGDQQFQDDTKPKDLINSSSTGVEPENEGEDIFDLELQKSVLSTRTPDEMKEEAELDVNVSTAVEPEELQTSEMNDSVSTPVEPEEVLNTSTQTALEPEKRSQLDISTVTAVESEEKPLSDVQRWRKQLDAIRQKHDSKALKNLLGEIKAAWFQRKEFSN